MDDYSKILEKEKKLLNKENLLDDTIVEDKLSKHEIISKMYKGLVSEIEELKSILFKDLAVTNESKEKAEKINDKIIPIRATYDVEKITEEEWKLLDVDKDELDAVGEAMSEAKKKWLKELRDDMLSKIEMILTTGGLLSWQERKNRLQERIENRRNTRRNS